MRTLLAFLSIGFCLGLTNPMTAQQRREGPTPRGARRPVHSPARPGPPVVGAGLDGPPRPPTAGAIVLFNGRDMSGWVTDSGAPARWNVRDGVMQIAPGTGAIRTQRAFGDIQLHI